jgi:hypothetical protein
MHAGKGKKCVLNQMDKPKKGKKKSAKKKRNYGY